MQRLFLFAAIVAGAASAQDQGFIHGTITLDDSKELTGVMRWGEQEVLWIHHFNGDKDTPYDLDQLADADRDEIRKNLPGPQFNINGHTVELVRWLGGSELRPQAFGIEFGHISVLEPGRGERVTLTLRDNSTVSLDGGADDMGADIEVITAGGSRHDVDWDDIERVTFHPPQEAAGSFPPHLHGVVNTRVGSFEGFVEWDQDERFPTEELDGDDASGQERSIDFASIVAIANQGESALVTLTDGTQTVLSDTNDVNSQNRGIVVTVPELGRVDIPWSAFETVQFKPPATALPRYSDFAASGPIEGRVTGSEQTVAGTLVFDLDHRHRGEMVAGYDSSGIEFRVPWYRIRQIEPTSAGTSRLTLVGGRQLDLGRDPDVTRSNNGLVLTADAGAKPVYLPWEKVLRIETDW